MLQFGFQFRFCHFFEWLWLAWKGEGEWNAIASDDLVIERVYYYGHGDAELVKDLLRLRLDVLVFVLTKGFAVDAMLAEDSAFKSNQDFACGLNDGSRLEAVLEKDGITVIRK